MDVCAQATPVIEFLKRDGSWGHTPPIENMLCKALSNYLLWEFKIYTCISTLYTTHVDMALCTCWYFNRVEKLLNLSLLPKLQIHCLDEVPFIQAVKLMVHHSPPQHSCSFSWRPCRLRASYPGYRWHASGLQIMEEVSLWWTTCRYHTCAGSMGVSWNWTLLFLFVGVHGSWPQVFSQRVSQLLETTISGSDLD